MIVRTKILLKKQFNSVNIFDSQIERIKLATGKRMQVELANFFGIRQSSVSDAKRRGKIPSHPYAHEKREP